LPAYIAVSVHRPPRILTPPPLHSSAGGIAFHY
jgi:hypothetical protein